MIRTPPNVRLRRQHAHRHDPSHPRRYEAGRELGHCRGKSGADQGREPALCSMCSTSPSMPPTSSSRKSTRAIGAGGACPHSNTVGSGRQRLDRPSIHPDRGSRSRGLSRVGGIGVELVQVWHASPSFKVRWSAAFTWPQWSGRRAEASPTDPSNRIPKVALSRLHQGIASALLQTQRRPRGRDDCL